MPQTANVAHFANPCSGQRSQMVRYSQTYREPVLEGRQVRPSRAVMDMACLASASNHGHAYHDEQDEENHLHH